jgi:uncharacterized Fe-S cluster protein YjdI
LFAEFASDDGSYVAVEKGTDDGAVCAGAHIAGNQGGGNASMMLFCFQKKPCVYPDRAAVVDVESILNEAEPGDFTDF